MGTLLIAGQVMAAGGQSEVSAEPVGAGGKPVTVVDSNALGQPITAKGPPAYYNLIFVAVLVVVMYLLLFREPRRRQKQQQKMVQTLKKNDKVRTIGGIIGTVVDVKDDEVILKVDEANNTKIRVLTSAIGKNLSGEGQ